MSGGKRTPSIRTLDLVHDAVETAMLTPGTIASANAYSALVDYLTRLEAAVERAVGDVNWMTNEGKLLNREVFEYLDELHEEFAPDPLVKAEK